MVYKEELEQLQERMQRIGKNKNSKIFSKTEVNDILDIFGDLTRPPKK